MRYDEGDCLDANKDDEEGKTAYCIQSTLSPTKIFRSISISWLALMISPSYAPGGRPSAGSVIHVHRITHIRPSTEYQRFRALAWICEILLMHTVLTTNKAQAFNGPFC